MSFESRNPATGELLGLHPEHDKKETNARLQRAWDGWRHWSRTPLRERIVFLTRLAESLTSVSALRSGAVTSPGPVALPARSSLEWYLSMISPAPIPAHRSEASRLQGMGANLALTAHWNLPTQN
jgi:Aldehyde dehydrogenase family